MGFFSFLNSKPSTPDYSGVIAGLNTAAQTSADRGVFKPVTISTTYGTPTYTYDAQGRLTGASSTMSPYLQGLQTGAQGLTSDYLTAAQKATGMTQPLQYADLVGGAGNRLFGLAEQALPTTYDVTGKTQDYYNRMQQLVAPQREKQLASTRNNLFQKGRQGLSVGATQTGGMLATNPEMAAYYNAITQQDLGLANEAEQRARANLQQDISTGTGLFRTGTGMYQTVPELQNAYYKNLTASQVPFTTGLGTLNTIESMGLQPLQLGLEFGRPTTAGMQYGGNLLWDAAQAGARLQAGQIDAQTRAANTPTFLQSLAMSGINSLAQAGINYATGGFGGSSGLFSGSGGSGWGTTGRTGPVSPGNDSGFASSMIY